MNEESRKRLFVISGLVVIVAGAVIAVGLPALHWAFVSSALPRFFVEATYGVEVIGRFVGLIAPPLGAAVLVAGLVMRPAATSPTTPSVTTER